MKDDNKLDTQEVADQKVELTLIQSISKNAIGLALFAFFTAGLIGITQITTADLIDQNVKDFKQKSLLELMPEGLIDNNVLNDEHEFDKQFDQLELLNLQLNDVYYLGFNDHQIQAIILPITAPDGYTGNIKMLAAISPEGKVLGVRVIEHKETPGLGDKIDIKKSQWITGFDNKNLNNANWKVTKDGGDFDAFTGATITPRAVVKSLQKALEFYDINKSVFLKHTQISVKEQ
ncbi:electron transport complex subunit RsxG [Marinicellulosiphila megalodicopiae]|uniref:electron transport complex subunit RsxG n=1 Tax=Marinicellulosiphila megalodicopiae TaxID=2724896 RepID=UPI003BB2210F